MFVVDKITPNDLSEAERIFMPLFPPLYHEYKTINHKIEKSLSNECIQ
jgi:hypothetical protein